MSESNTMDIDPPAPPAIPTGEGVTSTVPELEVHEQTAAANEASEEALIIPVEGSQEKADTHMTDSGPGPSAPIQALDTEMSAAAEPVQADEAMVIEETVKTTEVTILVFDTKEGDAPNIPATTAAEQQDIQAEETEPSQPDDAANGHSLIQQAVIDLDEQQSSGYTHPTTVTELDRFSSAPPIDRRAPNPDQPVTVRTGYIFDPLMMLHCADGYVPTADTVVEIGSGHPEEPMRIKRIFLRLSEMGLIRRMKQLAFKQVTMEQTLLVHTEDHWNKVQGTESTMCVLH